MFAGCGTLMLKDLLTHTGHNEMNKVLIAVALLALPITSGTHANVVQNSSAYDVVLSEQATREMLIRAGYSNFSNAWHVKGMEVWSREPKCVIARTIGIYEKLKRISSGVYRGKYVQLQSASSTSRNGKCGMLSSYVETDQTYAFFGNTNNLNEISIGRVFYVEQIVPNSGLSRLLTAIKLMKVCLKNENRCMVKYEYADDSAVVQKRLYLVDTDYLSGVYLMPLDVNSDKKSVVAFFNDKAGYAISMTIKCCASRVSSVSFNIVEP